MLAEEIYPEAEQIRLVCDNEDRSFSYYALGSGLLRALCAGRGSRLARRVEFGYTPTHGPWLNMVEIELSVLVRQCLRGRIGSTEELAQIVTC